METITPIFSLSWNDYYPHIFQIQVSLMLHIALSFNYITLDEDGMMSPYFHPRVIER